MCTKVISLKEIYIHWKITVHIIVTSWNWYKLCNNKERFVCGFAARCNN